MLGFASFCLVPGFGQGNPGQIAAASFDRPYFDRRYAAGKNCFRGRLGPRSRVDHASGQLVSDETVNRLVEERIEEPDANGFILDGYPADRAAGEAPGGAAEVGIRPIVVHLKVDYNVIIARLSGRRLCPTCGSLYRVNSNAPSSFWSLRLGRHRTCGS